MKFFLIVLLFIFSCSGKNPSEQKSQYVFQPLKYRMDCISENYFPIEIHLFNKNESLKYNDLFAEDNGLNELGIRWCDSVYGSREVKETEVSFKIQLSEELSVEKINSSLKGNSELERCISSFFKKARYSKDFKNREFEAKIKWLPVNWSEYIIALNNNDVGRAIYYSGLQRSADKAEYLALAIQKGKKEVALSIIDNGIYAHHSVGPNKFPLLHCAILNGEEKVVEKLLKHNAVLNCCQDVERYLDQMKESCKKTKNPTDYDNGCFPDIIKLLENYIKNNKEK